MGTNIHYQGKMLFDIKQFSGYRIRNVDRNKHVKDTQGITFVWSNTSTCDLSTDLDMPAYLQANYCALCRAGPFEAETDRQAHLKSKKTSTNAFL